MKAFMTILIFAVIYVPALLLFAVTPYITRKTESFGVSIPEEIYYIPEVKKIRSQYKNRVLLSGGIIAVISLILDFISSAKSTVLFLSIGLFVQLAVMFVFYIKGHRKMKVLKKSNNWTANKLQRVVVDTDFRKKRVLVSHWWFLLYVLIILATVGIGLLMYDKMPDKIPMNYNFNGEVIKWVNKSYKVLIFAPAMQTFIMFLMMFIYWVIGKAKQQVDAAHPERSIEQNRIFRYRWSAFIVFMGLVLMGVFGFTQLTIIGVITNVWVITLVPFGFTGAIIITAIILSFKTGQGGSRISIARTKSGEAINRDDDKYWKLGIFYYNPDDPALFVEKRFGVGWTNNFARPMSWAMIIGFIIILVLLFVGSMYLTK
ncbi:MAG: hypothetical protein PWP27_1460 [Clostridiales bacterium]|jgi:uncharacterized membrane protein|nr:hypothetical protein [Clostridiales bacterium]MDK2933650.1 hypothetical protein [Clostridiales bacterium]